MDAQPLSPAEPIIRLLRSLFLPVQIHGRTLGLALPLISLIVRHLHRIVDRIEYLAARGGPRPVAATPRGKTAPGPAQTAKTRIKPPHLLPRGFGWLVRTITSVANIASPTAGARDYLIVQFQRPDLQALIASDPAFAPVMRSLCAMFGITTPAWICRTPSDPDRPKPPRRKSPLPKPRGLLSHQTRQPLATPQPQPTPPPGISPLAFFFPGTYRT